MSPRTTAARPCSRIRGRRTATRSPSECTFVHVHDKRMLIYRSLGHTVPTRSSTGSRRHLSRSALACSGPSSAGASVAGARKRANLHLPPASHTRPRSFPVVPNLIKTMCTTTTLPLTPSSGRHPPLPLWHGLVCRSCPPAIAPSHSL
jgi:hypothetical protein